MNLKPWELPHRGAMSRQLLEGESAHQQGGRLRRGHGAFLRQGPRSPVRAGEALRLDSRLSGRRQVDHLGTRLPAVEQARVHRARATRLRHQLADRLRRRRAVVLTRREVHRSVRQRRSTSRRCPTASSCPPFDFNCVEKHLSDQLRAHYGNRHVVQGRWAHLSQPKEIHLQQGRGTCQARNLCMRGCPYGGYFSSNSSTLPWAAKTGNLTIRPRLGRALDHLRRSEGQGDRRARDRREHARRHRVSLAHHLRERVGAQHQSDPAQLDVEPIPARTRQRQRIAGQVRRVPQLSHVGERTDRRLRGQVLLHPEPDGVHPRQLPQSRKAGHGFRRRLHHVHRRVPRARRADVGARRRRCTRTR